MNIREYVQHKFDCDAGDSTQDLPCSCGLNEALARIDTVLAAASEREHVTDGSPCWCDPVIEKVEGGDTR